MSKRASTELIRKLLGALREADPTMPLQRAAVFLEIACEEGLYQYEIAERLAMSAASTSRNVNDLSAEGRKGGVGLGLVRADSDTDDARQRRLYLTVNGHRLVASLHKLIQAHAR